MICAAFAAMLLQTSESSPLPPRPDGREVRIPEGYTRAAFLLVSARADAAPGILAAADAWARSMTPGRPVWKNPADAG
jgi:hypothetical protein